MIAPLIAMDPRLLAGAGLIILGGIAFKFNPIIIETNRKRRQQIADLAAYPGIFTVMIGAPLVTSIQWWPI